MTRKGNVGPGLGSASVRAACLLMAIVPLFIGLEFKGVAASHDSHKDTIKPAKGNEIGVPEDEAAINKNVVGLIDGCLAPDYSGIRAFFGEEYADSQVEQGLLVKPTTDNSASGSSISRQFESYLWRDNIGPDGMYVVPYDYNPDATFSSSQRAFIDASLQSLSDKVGILQFRYRTTGDKEWVSIQSAPGCWSYIGKSRLAMGGQPLNLQNDACVVAGVIQHEIMHALGFYHEQNRPDRDDHVTINYDNIQAGRESNFAISSNVDTLGSPYDYGSVMPLWREDFLCQWPEDDRDGRPPHRPARWRQRR